jgi:L-galactono-1,4-lactone dehydrogenase
VEEQISELRLIDGTGTERILSPTNNPDLFKVAKAGLGGLGVLTSMKLKCTPRHRLLENTFVLNHKDMTPKYHHDLLKFTRNYVSFPLPILSFTQQQSLPARAIHVAS